MRATDEPALTRRARAALGPTSIALPLVMAAVLLVVLGLTALGGHIVGVSGSVARLGLSALASVLFIVAYLRWAKPTLVVFALFMLFVDTISRYLGYDVGYVDEMSVPLLFVVAAWRTRPWRTGGMEPVRDGAAAIVIVLAVVSSLVNGVPVGTWLPGLVLMAKVFAFLYIALWHSYDRADLRQFAIVMAVIGLPVVGLGYVETLAPEAVRSALGLIGPGRPARGTLPSAESIFYHPVLYGWFSAFLGLFAFAFYISLRRWWLLGLGVFFSAGAFLSARRRAIAGLVVALVAGLLADLRRALAEGDLRRAWLPVGGAVLVLAIVFASGLSDLIALTERAYRPTESPAPATSAAPGTSPAPGQLPQGAGQETARLALYARSVDVAVDYFPLGAGLGRYGSWMSRVDYSPLYERYGLTQIWGLRAQYPYFITDTFWPQILGEVGVFGLAAYLVFVVALGLRLWQAAGAPLEPLSRAFALGALMVFGHALVETLASSMFHSPPRIYLLFGAVGISLALLRDSGLAATSWPGRRRRRAPGQ